MINGSFNKDFLITKWDIKEGIKNNSSMLNPNLTVDFSFYLNKRKNEIEIIKQTENIAHVREFISNKEYYLGAFYLDDLTQNPTKKII